METPCYLQPYPPPTYTCSDFLEHIHLPGNDGLAWCVEVRRNDYSAGLLDSPRHIVRVGADQGDHPPRVLHGCLTHQAVPLRHEPHTIGETQTPRSVGRRVLAKRVAGHHVGSDPSLPQTVEKIHGTGEHGELVRYGFVTDVGERGVARGAGGLPSNGTLAREDHGPLYPVAPQTRSCTGSQPRSGRIRSQR